MPASITTSSAQFIWTTDVEASDPQELAYTVTIGTVSTAARTDVTFATQPFLLTGLFANTSYAVVLSLNYGNSSISTAVQNIRTLASLSNPMPPPITMPPASPDQIATNFRSIPEFSTDTSVLLDWGVIVNASESALLNSGSNSCTITVNGGKTNTVQLGNGQYRFPGLSPGTTYQFTMVLNYPALNFTQTLTTMGSTTGTIPVFGSAISGAVSWGQDRIDMLGSTVLGRLTLLTFDGTAWTTEDLQFSSAYNFPAIYTWGQGRLDIFAVSNPDFVLHHRFFDNGGWSNWESLGGPVPSGTMPAVASWSPNRLDVVFINSSGFFMHRYYDGTNWSPTWEVIQGGAADPQSISPALSAPSEGLLTLFAKGLDNYLYTNDYYGGVWTGFRNQNVKMLT